MRLCKLFAEYIDLTLKSGRCASLRLGASSQIAEIFIKEGKEMVGLKVSRTG
jgi:hypothetical protein